MVLVRWKVTNTISVGFQSPLIYNLHWQQTSLRLEYPPNTPTLRSVLSVHFAILHPVFSSPFYLRWPSSLFPRLLPYCPNFIKSTWAPSCFLPPACTNPCSWASSLNCAVMLLPTAGQYLFLQSWRLYYKIAVHNWVLFDPLQISKVINAGVIAILSPIIENIWVHIWS